MRILFSSDLHALMPAYRVFAKALAEGPYDAGVLAGDLLDDIRLPDEFLMAELGVHPDELLEDLAGAEDERPWETAARGFAAINLRGLKVLEARFRGVLASARKPVILVPGNHDASDWADGEGISNVHGRRLDLGLWNFVGYRWTSDHRTEEGMASELGALAPLVDRRSVLLTHNPCFGILDGESGHSIGSRALRALVIERRPSWHLFGHVHRAYGRRGRSVNGAYPRARAFFDIDLGRGKIEMVAADTDYPNPRWA